MTEGDISFTAKRLMGNKEKWFPRKIKVGFPEKTALGMYTKITHVHSQVRFCYYSGEWSFLCVFSVLLGHQASPAGCWVGPPGNLSVIYKWPKASLRRAQVLLRMKQKREGGSRDSRYS